MSAISPQICFVGNAQYAVADGDRLEMRTFGRDQTSTWCTGPIASLAAVGEELWIVTATAPMRLMRWRSGEGAPSTARASGVEFPDVSSGRLMASPLCRSSLAWNGVVPAKISAGASSASAEWVARSAQIAPVKPGEWLHTAGSTLRLQRGSVTVWQRQLPGIAEIRDVQTLFDGRAVGILAKTSDDKHRVLVLAARDGAPQQSLAVPELAAACFVPTAGEVVLGIEGRIAVVDLRFRETRAEWRTSAPPRALAVSSDGMRLVCAYVDRLEEVPIERGAATVVAHSLVVAEPVPIASSIVTPAPAQAERPAATTEPAPISLASLDNAAAEIASPPARKLPSMPLLALAPKAAAEPSTAAESALVLEHHLRCVKALVVRAIAEAWDRGRLNHAADDHPYLTEVLAIVRDDARRAPTYLEAAEQRLAVAQERLDAVIRQLGTRQAPLTRLAVEFGLAPLATQLLAVIAAPLLYGELARLYGIVSNDSARPLVDELLLHQVFDSRASRADISRELDLDAPLRRFGLVHQRSNAPRPFSALTPDPLVLRHLRGLSMNADIEPNLRPLAPCRELEDLRAPQAELARCMTALAHPRAADDPVRLVVRGRAGSGRRCVLAALASRAGRLLGVIDASQPCRDPEARLAALKAALGDALLRGWIPCIVGLDDVSTEDHKLRDELAMLFRRHPGPLTLHLPSLAQAPLAPGYLVLDLPQLLEGERVGAWTEALTRHGLATDQVPTLAARYRIGPGIIERVTMSVAARQPTADVCDELDREIRQHVAIQFGRLAQKVERLPTWADVVLAAEVRDSLLELIGRIRQRRRVYETWGFDRIMSTSRGTTALLQGGPGTGKSMVAGVMARELGLDLYRVDLSNVVSKWIGETERNLATVFDAAEDGQCVLLFDEADSLFARRTEVRSSNDRYANLEVNYLLQRLDTFEGIAILTTNLAGSIDRAFKRRLSLRLTFPFPDEELREQLWRAHLPEELPRGELDLASLARRYMMTGGYIRNAALRAAFLAAEEGVVVTQHHLERAVRLEFRELGKLSESGVLE